MSEEKLLEAIGRIVEEKVEKVVDKKMDQKLEALEGRMNARFEALEKKTDARFEALEEKTDSRFETLEGKMDANVREIKHNIALILQSQNEMRAEMQENQKAFMETFNKYVEKNEVEHTKFEYRTTRLERKCRI